MATKRYAYYKADDGTGLAPFRDASPGDAISGMRRVLWIATNAVGQH